MTIRDYTYRSTVGSMGGRFMIPISADVRQNAGVAAGDAIEVDIEPRELAARRQGPLTHRVPGLTTVGSVPKMLRVTTRNARFQQWQALLTNRAKRQRAGEFLVQGVRPITLAVRHGWEIHTWLYPDDHTPSTWATELLDRVPATRIAMSGELLRELGEKSEDIPELVAVVGIPDDSLERIPTGHGMLVIVFDRPTAPGNIGTLIRSADALGASGVVVTGHAADPYDPKAVRASTGSLFAVPVVRAASHGAVVDWVAALRAGGLPVRIVGTDEHGAVELADRDLTGPSVVAIGNETHGLSGAWRLACDEMVHIPMSGAASSLNAAAAATVVLYEAARQRRRAAGS